MKYLFNKKGMTLAEICIVLAIVAVVSTIVVSFTIMVKQNISMSKSNVDAMSDIKVIESAVEGWVYQQEILGNDLSLEGDFLKGKKGEEEYSLSFVDNTIKGTLPDGKGLEYSANTIKSVKFELYDKKIDTLIICTVNYYVSNGKELEVKSYVFCVNQYIGDIIA